MNYYQIDSKNINSSKYEMPHTIEIVNDETLKYIESKDSDIEVFLQNQSNFYAEFPDISLGNLIDRLFYTKEFLHNSWAGVVDWIDFIGIRFAVFNIADACVVIGVFMLIAWLIVDEVKTVRAKRAEEVKETGGKVLSKEEQKRLEQEQVKEEPVTQEKEAVSEEKE